MELKITPQIKKVIYNSARHKLLTHNEKNKEKLLVSENNQKNRLLEEGVREENNIKNRLDYNRNRNVGLLDKS